MSSLTDDRNQKFNDAIETIKSLRYSVEVNLASGTRMFLRIVRDSQPYKDLLEVLQADFTEYGMKAGVILRRLVLEPFDMAYANPNDTAMSVLALVLRDAGAEKSDVYAIVLDARSCWWLPQVVFA